ncbi:respiratory chain complexes assembly protein [Pseudozyma hubeiensis SY62]|uniref:Respiratory chain complexes assembly protein n=1 Tax=Pseudozyma hubeiensis (strain SY62) TaxID=1305764 RepID=R9P295_PSEHS|nr:respiratory chain complexes assembly protein [Pseudozyma hubeiensis SY62]GAC95349.1 respiratory chain complexes assembly protein [Pseudozyma hubeiensis SY62]
MLAKVSEEPTLTDPDGATSPRNGSRSSTRAQQSTKEEPALVLSNRNASDMSQGRTRDRAGNLTGGPADRSLVWERERQPAPEREPEKGVGGHTRHQAPLPKDVRVPLTSGRSRMIELKASAGIVCEGTGNVLCREAKMTLGAESEALVHNEPKRSGSSERHIQNNRSPLASCDH